MGFDYLRDNMAIYKDEMVQRGHSFAIVDEVDSILIDEARTPLIISGQGDESHGPLRQADDFVSRLKRTVFASSTRKRRRTSPGLRLRCGRESQDRNADGAGHRQGGAVLRRWKTSPTSENSTLSHHINQALKAHGVMKRDIDYVVKDGEVIIVDEFTGRLMLGRRYSEGLHQAIEAKEHVEVARENKTLATITFQNYFRLYDKLSGMTGTAVTEQEEFVSIYGLDVVEIPTNRPVARIDQPDVVYKNENGKYRAVIDQIGAATRRASPCWWARSPSKRANCSPSCSSARASVITVLNAKNHEKEAEIVAQAGQARRGHHRDEHGGPRHGHHAGRQRGVPGQERPAQEAGFDEEIIAEATGYADTDDEDVLAARTMYAERLRRTRRSSPRRPSRCAPPAACYILGTERHESRRIDNQLRGRAGRQGDPGESRFFLAMDGRHHASVRLRARHRHDGALETRRGHPAR